MLHGLSFKATQTGGNINPEAMWKTGALKIQAKSLHLWKEPGCNQKTLNSPKDEQDLPYIPLFCDMYQKNSDWPPQ